MNAGEDLLESARRRDRDHVQAARYRWLVENAVIEFDAPHGRVRHDGKDSASTQQPLDNAIDAARNAGVLGTASPQDQAIYEGIADGYFRDRAPGVEGRND